jgi:hypothetical protein
MGFHTTKLTHLTNGEVALGRNGRERVLHESNERNVGLGYTKRTGN